MGCLSCDKPFVLNVDFVLNENIRELIEIIYRGALSCVIYAKTSSNPARDQDHLQIAVNQNEPNFFFHEDARVFEQI